MKGRRTRDDENSRDLRVLLPLPGLLGGEGGRYR